MEKYAMKGRNKRNAALVKKRRNNTGGMALITFVLLIVIFVIGVNTYNQKQKQAEYLQREANLDSQITQEMDRSHELAEFKKYTQTQAYIEEVAKDKLGLVRDGQIVFKLN